MGVTSNAYIYHKNQGGTDNWGKVAEIHNNVGGFGCDADIFGNYAIVGAYTDDDNGEYAGAAFIYYKDQGGEDNWGQLKKITASDGLPGDHFGYSVCINENYALIGAPWDDDNGNRSGTAYLFYKDEGGTNNWGQIQKLTANDGGEGDRFGVSLDLNKDIAIIGASLGDFGNVTSGSAYLFVKDAGETNNWSQLEKIGPSDGVYGVAFGCAVSISDCNVFVGAYGYDDDGSNAGAVYIYGKPMISNQLDDLDIYSNTIAGYAVGGFFGIENCQWQVSRDNGNTFTDITDNLLYEGINNAGLTFRANDTLNHFVYRCLVSNFLGSDTSNQAKLTLKPAFNEIKEIIASDNAVDDYFGYSVDISGDYAIVGDGRSSGSAYIFYRDQGGANNWGELSKLTASPVFRIATP